ncbi:MAG: LicD family protein [Phascolarctobacterium sp.]|nr:LicD family protein [Phascolarctobacterium sp.]
MLPLKINLSDNFYKEEYRSGYLVTRDIKELWAIELDLLVKFDEVCRKYQIRYFLAYGTLLGAVRHKGFIPWDDDIDVVIFREDYDKLISIAEVEFNDLYLLQSAYTDKNYMRGHFQLRNTKTCMMLPYEAKIVEFNQGVFLDIFVLDGLVKDECLLKKQLVEMNRIRRLMKHITYRNSTNMFKKMIKKIKAKYVEIIFGSVKELFDRYSKIAEWYSDSEDVEILMFRYKIEECERYKRCWYDDVCYMEFEGMSFPVPKCYDEVLKVGYGEDYMTPKQVGTSHGKLIVSTVKTFSEVLKEMR